MLLYRVYYVSNQQIRWIEVCVLSLMQAGMCMAKDVCPPGFRASTWGGSLGTAEWCKVSLMRTWCTQEFSMQQPRELLLLSPLWPPASHRSAAPSEQAPSAALCAGAQHLSDTVRHSGSCCVPAASDDDWYAQQTLDNTAQPCKSHRTNGYLAFHQLKGPRTFFKNKPQGQKCNQNFQKGQNGSSQSTRK